MPNKNEDHDTFFVLVLVLVLEKYKLLSRYCSQTEYEDDDEDDSGKTISF